MVKDLSSSVAQGHRCMRSFSPIAQHPHTRRLGRRHAGDRIFNNDTSGGVRAEGLRRMEEEAGVRLPMTDLMGAKDAALKARVKTGKA